MRLLLIAVSARLLRATREEAVARVPKLRLQRAHQVQSPGSPAGTHSNATAPAPMPAALPVLHPSVPNLPGLLPAVDKGTHDLIGTLWALGLAPLSPNTTMAAREEAADFPYWNASQPCDPGPIPGLDLGYYQVGEPFERIIHMNASGNASFTLPYWNQSSFGYDPWTGWGALNDTYYAGLNVSMVNYTFDLRSISCAAGNLPTRGGPTYAACVNGTWKGVKYYNQVVQKPVLLNCQSEEQVRLLKEIQFYWNWTKTEWDDADSRHFVWKDSNANFRKATLHQLFDAAAKLVNDTTMDEWLSVEDLRKVRDAFIEYRIQPRGEQYTQETCEDFANHTLYEYPKPSTSIPRFATSNVAPVLAPSNPDRIRSNKTAAAWSKAVDWDCRYTAQKSAIGWDTINHEPVIYYREGCYCESRMMLGCPFKYPGYAYAGFSALEEKPVTGANGLTALCWYWSDPVHPEWGYMRVPANEIAESGQPGSALEAPVTNSSQLIASIAQ